MLQFFLMKRNIFIFASLGNDIVLTWTLQTIRMTFTTFLRRCEKLNFFGRAMKFGRMARCAAHNIRQGKMPTTHIVKKGGGQTNISQLSPKHFQLAVCVMAILPNEFATLSTHTYDFVKHIHFTLDIFVTLRSPVFLFELDRQTLIIKPRITFLIGRFLSSCSSNILTIIG